MTVHSKSPCSHLLMEKDGESGLALHKVLLESDRGWLWPWLCWSLSPRVPDTQQSLKSEPSQRQEVLVADVVTKRDLVGSVRGSCMLS